MKKFNVKHSFMLTGFAFMVTTSLFSHQAHAEGNHPIDINFLKIRLIEIQLRAILSIK